VIVIVYVPDVAYECANIPAPLYKEFVPSPQSTCTSTSPKSPISYTTADPIAVTDCPTIVVDDVDGTPVDDVDDVGGTVGGGGNSVSICKIKLSFDGTDVVADGTVVVTDGTEFVTDGIVVVTDELTQAVEDVCNVAAPIPKTSNGTAATIVNRPADARTQRATANPMTSNTSAARAKPKVPPVSGNLHTSTAIMIHPAFNRHQYGDQATASKECNLRTQSMTN
jgi:hypothetical protein